MFLPLRTDSPLRTTPYMNWALIVANVAMFIVQKANPQVEVDLRLYANAPWLVAFITYGFLHAGVVHLAGNMLFLYIFGNNVNDKMGHVGYLLFYLAGIVFSGIAYVLSADVGSVVGASGATWAVTGAYLVLFPRAHVTVFSFFIILGHFELPSWIFVALQLARDVIGIGMPVSQVAHVAHLGGAAFGFALTLALLAATLLPRDQFDVWALIKQWNRRRQYRDMVAKGYNPFAYAPGGPAGPAAGGDSGLDGPADPRVTELRTQISNALAKHELPLAAELYLQLRAIDPQQVLSRQAQLDVANQLNAEQRYEQAAGAYEVFLEAYPKFEQIEQVELLLGIIYGRYLKQYDRAKGLLVKAMARLHGENQIQMARSELVRIEPFTVQTGPAL